MSATESPPTAPAASGASDLSPGQPAHTQGLGEESSIWFKLMPLTRGGADPMKTLAMMVDRYGSVIPINMGSERVVLLCDPGHFKRVLVTNVDNYLKYFDGLKPIFGKSMITHDGVLWQKIRMPQQAAFHPDMFAEYIPYFLSAIEAKSQTWGDYSRSGERFEMVEQTWTLAADMICKALFDRDMPFNPHVVFKCVKTYTDVMNHKEIRLKVTQGEAFEMTEENAAKAMEIWANVPPSVIASDPREERERTLLTMIQACVDDPARPEFDVAQAVDELKQYLWAGTETTALTLAWAMYETSRRPDVLTAIREEHDRVLGDRPPTAADYSALVYTRAVIQETMRLYPPIWGLIRVAAKDDEIGGKLIKAGDRVVMFAYGIHRSAKYWPEPERFDPTRWIGDQKRVPYTYLPFGGGKRSCIGGAMSQVENTLALSVLLDRYALDYAGSKDSDGSDGQPLAEPQINATVTLTPRGGLYFRVKERKRGAGPS